MTFPRWTAAERQKINKLTVGETGLTKFVEDMLTVLGDLKLEIDRSGSKSAILGEGEIQSILIDLGYVSYTKPGVGDYFPTKKGMAFLKKYHPWYK